MSRMKMRPNEFIQEGWRYRNRLVTLTHDRDTFRLVSTGARQWLKDAKQISGENQTDPFVKTLEAVLPDPSVAEIDSWVSKGSVPAKWSHLIDG
jgi:hypothetical protein